MKGKKAFPPPLGVLFYWLICMLCSALELLEVIANRERKVPLTALEARTESTISENLIFIYSSNGGRQRIGVEWIDPIGYGSLFVYRQ